LSKAKPFDGCIDDKKLWARLRINYDDLAQNEQNKFLDFACIFVKLHTLILTFMYVRIGLQDFGTFLLEFKTL
jgi:hypothetical protein